MALENIIERLRALSFIVGSEDTQKRVSLAASIAVLATMKRRIFTDGLATDGSKIGTYSTNPYYQNPNNLIGVAVSGVKPMGKNGLSQFKSGKQKKTKYLAQGYKELRDLTGRQSNFVDLNFSGSTSGALQFGLRGNVAVVGFVNQEAAEIIQESETRFGLTIIEPSTNERELGARAAQEEIIAILSEI
jgi:hypothetical protein